MNDSLTYVFNQITICITAERIAEKYELSRVDEDEFALNSHLKAHEAIQAGKFDKEIVPLEDINGEMMNADELVRPESNMEDLGALNTIFKEDGAITAGKQ